MMTKFILSALLLLSGPTMAQQKLEIPYQPSAKVVTEIQDSPMWVEIYDAPRQSFSEVFDKLLSQQELPEIIGVVAPDVLYLRLNGKELSLLQRTLQVTREGTPIQYREDCSVLPELGDAVTLKFARLNPKVEATLTLKVLDYRVFGQSSRFASTDQALVRLPEPNVNTCDSVSEYRTVLSGEMVVSAGARNTFKKPIVAQTIFLKN